MRMGFTCKLLLCGVCLGGLELVGAAWAGGGHTKVAAHSRHQHSGIFLSSSRTAPWGVICRFYSPPASEITGYQHSGVTESRRTRRGHLPGGHHQGLPWGPQPRPPQPPVPTTSKPATEADKRGSERSRASKWKSKQAAFRHGHILPWAMSPWQSAEGRGAGLRALESHWDLLRAPTPPCLCSGHHHGLCLGGGKVLGYGEPRLGPGQSLKLDKSQHHLCINLAVAAPAPLEAESKGTWLPSCPSPGTLCALDLQRRWAWL